MTIQWEHVGQPKFDRIVEALIHRMYVLNSEVRAIDGRGGDGGIDILVTQGQRKRIFQLKYFPGGFPAEARTRRKQIKRSFERAMDHSPYEWTLVVPCNLTPKEIEFIQGLNEEESVQISFMGRVELDSKLSAFPDLVDFFTRDQLLESAKIYNQEKAIMTGGPADLTDRVRNLGRVTDANDRDWTFDFFRTGNSVTRVLRAKHPHAHEVSPINISMHGKIREVPGLANVMDRSLGYGAGEAFTIPAEAVERLTVEGPEWLTESYEGVEVTWSPVPHPLKDRARVELHFTDNAEVITASHVGKMQHCGSGAKGFSLKAVFHEVINLTFLFAYDGEKSSLQCALNVEDAEVSNVIRAAALNKELNKNNILKVSIDGNHLGTVSFHQSSPDEAAERIADISEWEALASDLDVVQRHCGIYFPMPTFISAKERVFLRVARLLIDGSCVVHPEIRTLTTTLNGNESPELRELFSDTPHAIKAEFESTSIYVAGRELSLGRATVFHPEVYTVNRMELRSSLAQGRLAGARLGLRPKDREYFRIFLPERWPDMEKHLVVTPWNLPGVSEPGTR